MKVVVCGGGLGGLTLAHALRGVADVTVVDRDRAAQATGGYRLHLDAGACRVLGSVLPTETWAAIRALADEGASFSRFTITDDRLRAIVSEAQDPAEDRLLCRRVALRVLLAEALEGEVRFGQTVRRVGRSGAGGVVELMSGEVLEADLVVGAEGGNSPTMTALAGAPTARPTGLFGLAGVTPLQPGDRIPSFLHHGPALSLDGSGTGLFLSLTGTSHRDVPSHLAALADLPSLVWGVIAREDRTPKLNDDEGDLGGQAVGLLRRWEPRMIELVARATPDSVARYTFRSVDPARDLTPWTPGHVTAIGDAVHCMPPTGGRAAATAIRDAGFLGEQLARCGSTPAGVRAAVAAYEEAMPKWSVPAIEESLRPVRVMRALRNPLLAAGAGPAIHCAADLGELRRRILA